MEDTEEEKRPPPSDICSQINLISSIQYQQNELSKLAKLLQSERDREKYIKVIEMSKIIQSKLDYLQDEKKKANITLCTNKNRNSFGHLDKKNSMWSLSNYYYTNSCRSSTATSSTTSGYSSGSENTLSTHSSSIYCISSGLEEEEEFSPGNKYIKIYIKEKKLEITCLHAIINLVEQQQQQQQQSRYHTYNGHSYRVIDRATSLQFQHMQDSIYNSRRPSADIILVDLCLKKEQEKVYVKSNSLQHRKSRNKKRRSFKATTTASTSRASMEISDEEEEVLKAIHVAVRRDASLFKIVKDKPIQDNIALTTTNKNYHSAVVTTTAAAAAAAITTPKNAIIPVVHPLPPLPHHLFEQNVVIEKKRVSFSDEQNNKKKTSPPTNGLFTPPDSPASQNRFDREISAESCLDLNALPHIIHVQKVKCKQKIQVFFPLLIKRYLF
jgi:hypothetical protein